jgi:hypothetical protein
VEDAEGGGDGFSGSESRTPPLSVLSPASALSVVYFAATAGVEAGVPLRVPGGTDFLASAYEA